MEAVSYTHLDVYKRQATAAGTAVAPGVGTAIGMAAGYAAGAVSYTHLIAVLENSMAG